MLVLLDTSILIYLVERPSSFIDEVRAQLGRADLCVLQPAVGELRSLAQTKGAQGRKAKAALSFAEGLRVFPGRGEADDALVRVAVEEGAVVATLDKELMSSLRRKGVPVATVRGDRLLLPRTGKHLIMATADVEY